MVILLCSLARTAAAADADASAGAVEIPSIPSTPAFDALGVTPSDVLRPASSSALGADLLTMVQDDGSLSTGFAFEVAPIWLFTGRKVTLQEWRKSPAHQLASRTTLAIATAPLDSGTGVSESLTVVWLDNGDPRKDKELSSCVTKALAASDPDPTLDDSTSGIPVDDDAIGACKADAAVRNANKLSLASAVATTQRESGSGLDHEVAFGSFDAWTSLGIPLGKSGSVGQLVAAAHYETADFADHGLDLGGQLRIGVGNASIAADFLWSPTFPDGAAAQVEAYRAAASAEVPINKTFTVAGSFGAEFGPDVASPELTSTVVLKVGGRSISLPVL